MYYAFLVSYYSTYNFCRFLSDLLAKKLNVLVPVRFQSCEPAPDYQSLNNKVAKNIPGKKNTPNGGFGNQTIEALDKKKTEVQSHYHTNQGVLLQTIHVSRSVLAPIPVVVAGGLISGEHDLLVACGG